jgi:hypothetical protein
MSIGSQSPPRAAASGPFSAKVTLSDLGPNCTVQGGSATRTVTLAARETEHVDFEVACTATP